MRYKPKEFNAKNFAETMKENWKQLNDIDQKAKEKGELLYRYITEPIADGQAVYQIIRVNKRTVRIRVCTGLGDDWQIPYWGKETTIDKKYAVQKVAQRDVWAEIFTKKGKENKMEGFLKAGDKFIIDTNICQDVDVINWYLEQPDRVLIAKHVEEDVNGVWVEDCPYRIDLSEIEKIEA